MDDYQNRNVYRKRINAGDLIFYRVCYKETDLLIGSVNNLSDCINKTVINTREMIDEHIENNPQFRDSLNPIGYNGGEHNIIWRMYETAAKANVGPMAAVAGAFCFAVYEALKDDVDELIIENGGDLLLWSKTERITALYAGDSPLSMKMGIRIKPEDTPIGICTSAGTFGHSKSFGKADMALCISQDIMLADACATALGNRIQTEADLKPAVEAIIKTDGISGAIAVKGDHISAVGAVELIPLLQQQG